MGGVIGMDKEIGCNSAKVIPVIETKITRGSGKSEDDIVRVITEYWTLEGRKLAEVDPTEMP